MKSHKVTFKYSSYTIKNLNNKNSRQHYPDLNALLCLFASLMPEEKSGHPSFCALAIQRLAQKMGVLIFHLFMLMLGVSRIFLFYIYCK